MINSQCPNIAIIGMGGYAIHHHESVLELEREGVLRLLATCDPCIERRASLPQFQLEDRDVFIFDSLETTLRECAPDIDVVALPTPIQCHVDMHKACIQAGIPCYLEKPPTLHWGEYQQMLENEKEAQSPTFVGFNFQADPVRLMLRDRMVKGEFGDLKELRLHGFWPRPESYFKRNGWAGRLWSGDYPVMDSVTGNAMAHFVQNMFHWAGVAEGRNVAKLSSVESKLWRANDIESYDSILARAIMASGLEVRIAATHASAEQNTNLEVVVCEKATIYFDVYRGYKIVKNGRVTEEGGFFADQALARNYKEYFACLREGRQPCNTLEACESFVLYNGLNLISSAEIGTLDYTLPKQSKTGRGEVRHSAEFTKMAKRFLHEGELPDSSVSSQPKTLADIESLDTKLQSLRQDKGAPLPNL